MPPPVRGAVHKSEGKSVRVMTAYRNVCGSCKVTITCNEYVWIISIACHQTCHGHNPKLLSPTWDFAKIIVNE